MRLLWAQRIIKVWLDSEIFWANPLREYEQKELFI